MNQAAQDMQTETLARAKALVDALNDPAQSTIIETRMDAKGGFYAANLSNRTIEYAYPSSTHAVAARKSPAKVAEEMLFSQSHLTAATERPQWAVDRWRYMREQMLKAEPPSRFTDPAYLKAERNVARSEKAIRRAVNN